MSGVRCQDPLEMVLTTGKHRCAIRKRNSRNPETKKFIKNLTEQFL